MRDSVACIGLKGHVKIETFDGYTHKKQAETEGHNLFTNYGLEKFRKYCLLAMGGQFGANAYFTENSADDVYYGASNIQWGFLKNLILTDNTAAIFATDRIIPGVLTGYAQRQYATPTVATQGILNMIESSLYTDNLRVVMDFDTSHGVGTHRSVFWSDQTPGAYGYLGGFTPYTNARFARAYTQFTEADDGFFYGTVGTTLYKINPTTLVEITTYTLDLTPLNAGCFDVANGKCYYTSGTNSTSLHIYDLATGVVTTKTLTSLSSCYGIAVIGNYLYYSRSTTNIYRYNLTTDVITNNAITLITAAILRRSGGNLYVAYNSTSYAVSVYNFDTNTLTSIGSGLDTGAFNAYSLTAGTFWYLRALTSYYNGTTTNSNNVVQIANPANMRANMITGKVLDTPIVKSNTQTMKVTYTIAFS